MNAAAAVVFREVLEIALALGLVAAAARQLRGRNVMMISGLLVGILGSCILAFFTERLSTLVSGKGQELFNAGVMFTAVGFLVATVIWMRKHGRETAARYRAVGKEVRDGAKPLAALSAVIALATLREGAEIVLFSYGMAASGTMTLAEIIAGGFTGAAGGSLAGYLLYKGLLGAAQRKLFTLTGWMLLLLAAGMAAQGANFLIAAGVLPPLSAAVWDTSHWISSRSFAGQFLSALVGYTPRPTAMELVFYAGVLTGAGALYTKAGGQATALVPGAVKAA